MSTLPLQVWMITGCSSGFGYELVKAALEAGHAVVATARSMERLSDILIQYPDRCIGIPLDVKVPQQITSAVAQAQKRFGRIDVLVNNAGYGYLAAVEEGEDAAIRDIFETNYFGLAALIRAVLPQMRERRSGHIVNIGSVGGITGFIGVGYYCSTKFAVEGLSTTLAKELAPLGIKVTVVEPGPIRTEYYTRSAKMSPVRIAEYDDILPGRKGEAAFRANPAGDPVRGAQAVVKAVASENPPLHLPLGKFAMDAARTKLAEMQRELDVWEAVAVATDFPD